MSNLTVSYVSQTPAGTPAGATADAPAADSPLGFLTALLDQILAAGTEPTTATTAQADGGIDVPGLLNVALASQTTTTAKPADLVATLTGQLDLLQSDTSTSGEPSRLGDAIDALIAAIGTPSAQAGASTANADPSADATALRDRLSALGQSLAATNPGLAQKLQTLAEKLETVATEPALAAQLGLTAQPDGDASTIANIIRSLLGHKPAAESTDTIADVTTAPQVQDNLLQILATLGLNTSPVSTTVPAISADPGSASESAAASAVVPSDLLRLSTQLTQVASGIAATSPDLAKKLEAVATRLVSTDAGPDLLAKLTGAAAQSNGTALDKLVQNLIEAKPVSLPTAAAPQIAAATLPAPVAPSKSKSVATEVKAAPPEPAPVAADSAPKPAPSASVAAAPYEPAADPEPKTEAKVVAEVTKPDPAQPVQPQPQPVPAAQQARALPAAYQPVANPINMGQVAFEMVRQAHQGTSRFTIRLDPPEMGRVDVRMHVDANGAVNAHLTVDRAETLDLFQRDRQSLERALAQAGLDASKTSLEFSLRQNSHNPFAGMMGGDQRQQQPGYGAPQFSLAGSDDTAMPAITLYRGTASAGGVNIFA